MKHTENLGKLSDAAVSVAEDLVKVASASTGALTAIAQTIEIGGLYAKGEMTVSLGEAFSSEDRRDALKTGGDAIGFLKDM